LGLIGFLTWQDDTEEVITNNLPTKELKLLVNLILVIKALLSYPLPYYASIELIESSFFKKENQKTNDSKFLFPSCYDEDYDLKFWAVCLRITLILFTLLLAIFIPHFALLMVKLFKI
jgi:vesicular inhibitory amino acid transporter